MSCAVFIDPEKLLATQRPGRSRQVKNDLYVGKRARYAISISNIALDELDPNGRNGSMREVFLARQRIS